MLEFPWQKIWRFFFVQQYWWSAFLLYTVFLLRTEHVVIQLITTVTGRDGELGATVQTSAEQELRKKNVLFAARLSTMHLLFCSVCSNCAHIACPTISSISPAHLAPDVKVGVGKFNFEILLQSISECDSYHVCQNCYIIKKI